MDHIEHTKCPCCGKHTQAYDMVRINGHTMCQDCSFDYGDYMFEQQRDRELMATVDKEAQ